MRISVITPRFAFSGVPLAQHRLARALAEAGHEVEFVVGLIDEGYVIPDIPGAVIHSFGEPRVRRMLPRLRRYLIERQPDLIFSAEDHLNVAVLAAAITSKTSSKISCSSRVTPFDTYHRKPRLKGWALKQAMRAVMWRADVLTCVSKDMVSQYRRVFPHGTHTDVYNIVVDREARRSMHDPVDEPWFEDDVPVLIGAGTLAPWKGFDVLLDAVAKVVRHRPVRLIILGDGPSRLDLQAQVHRLGLDGHVKMPGFVPNPLRYFSRARTFVLSSRVEGLPNVLVEAMACGCTPVSTDCATGPQEVLAGGRYGYLGPVDDSDALAANIEKALDRPIPAALLNEGVRPFTTEVVLERHFELLGLRAEARAPSPPSVVVTTTN